MLVRVSAEDRTVSIRASATNVYRKMFSMSEEHNLTRVPAGRGWSWRLRCHGAAAWPPAVGRTYAFVERRRLGGY